MSLTHHEVSDRQVAANQSSAQKSRGWIRKSERAKPESLFETATSTIAMRSTSPIPKGEANGLSAKSQAQPSPRPRRLATEPSRTQKCTTKAGM